MNDLQGIACDPENDPPVGIREIEPLLLRIPEAAKVLAISERLAYDWVRDGIIPIVTLGNKRRVPVGLLRELVARREAERTKAVGEVPA